MIVVGHCLQFAVISYHAAAQARRCFEISRAALEQLGAGLQDVIRTRILLTRIQDWKAVPEVYGEFFRDIRPVNTILQVNAFIDPDWLIETEVDAVLAVSSTASLWP